MSSVMRPAGPLPPRVYWVRRLLLLVVLVVIVSVLWWCLQKVTGSADESQGSNAADKSASSSDATDQPTDAGSTATADDQTDESDANKPATTGKHHKKKHGNGKPALLAPSGPCDVTAVDMRVEAKDVNQGRGNPITLLMTGPAGSACTQPITPDTLVLRITSGKDVIWSSDDCPDKLLASEVVVRDRPAAKYVFNWDGRRSTGSCAGTGNHALPGGYWIEAALIGADAHKSYFDIRA